MRYEISRLNFILPDVQDIQDIWLRIRFTRFSHCAGMKIIFKKNELRDFWRTGRERGAVVCRHIDPLPRYRVLKVLPVFHAANDVIAAGKVVFILLHLAVSIREIFLDKNLNNGRVPAKGPAELF